MDNLSSVITEDELDINKKYHLHIIVPVLWSLIIFFGILGNGLIIYIILKRRLYKNSCTHCYIINVAVADLCFTLICVPITMSAYIYNEWIFGKFMCKFENLLMFSSVQAVCLTLAAMTIDRYMAILYPLKSIDFRTTKMAFLTNIFIWIASFVLNIPYYFYYHEEVYPENIIDASGNHNTREINFCISIFPTFKSRLLRRIFPYQERSDTYYESRNGTVHEPGNEPFSLEMVMTIYTVLISYVIPLIIIFFCYIRMLQKLAKRSRAGHLREEYRSSFSDRKRLSRTSTYSSKYKNEKRICSTELVNLKKQDATNGGRSLKSVLKHPTNSLDQQARNTVFNDESSPNPLETQISLKKVKSTRANLQKKQRTKLLFLVATVSITFATTWLPAHVIQIWKVVFEETFPYTDAMYLIKVAAHTLTYSNSLLNPIIYVFIGAKFRNYIKQEFNTISKILCLKQTDTTWQISQFSTATHSTKFMQTSSLRKKE